MKITIEGVDDLLASLREFPKELAAAKRNAVNATATAVRREGFLQMFRVFHIDKAQRLKETSVAGKETTFIERAKPGREYAQLTYRGGDNPKARDRIGLWHFADPASLKKRKGNIPRYTIYRGGKTQQTNKNTFFLPLGTLKHGGGGLVEARKLSGSYKATKLVMRTGPSVKQMFDDPKVNKPVIAHGEKVLRDKLEESLAKQIAKMNR